MPAVAFGTPDPVWTFEFHPPYRLASLCGTWMKNGVKIRQAVEFDCDGTINSRLAEDVSMGKRLLHHWYKTKHERRQPPLNLHRWLRQSKIPRPLG
jgi:hypothetical protein